MASLGSGEGNFTSVVVDVDMVGGDGEDGGGRKH